MKLLHLVGWYIWIIRIHFAEGLWLSFWLWTTITSGFCSTYISRAWTLLVTGRNAKNLEQIRDHLWVAWLRITDAFPWHPMLLGAGDGKINPCFIKGLEDEGVSFDVESWLPLTLPDYLFDTVIRLKTVSLSVGKINIPSLYHVYLPQRYIHSSRRFMN
jgi:hypothetical protein